MTRKLNEAVNTYIATLSPNDIIISNNVVQKRPPRRKKDNLPNLVNDLLKSPKTSMILLSAELGESKGSRQCIIKTVEKILAK